MANDNINPDLQQRLREYKEQKRAREKVEGYNKKITSMLGRLANTLSHSNNKLGRKASDKLFDLVKNKPYKNFVSNVGKGFTTMTGWSNRFFKTFNKNATQASSKMDDLFKVAILQKLQGAGDQVNEGVQSLYDVQVEMSRKFHMSLAELQEANKKLFEARDELGDKFNDKEVWQQALNRKDAGLRLGGQADINVARNLAKAEKILEDKFDGKEFATLLRNANNMGIKTQGSLMVDAMVSLSKTAPEIYDAVKSGFSEIAPDIALITNSDKEMADYYNKLARAEKRKQFMALQNSTLEDTIKGGDLGQIIQKISMMGLNVEETLHAYETDKDKFQKLVEQGTNNLVGGLGYQSKQDYLKNGNAFGYYQAAHQLQAMGFSKNDLDNYSKIKKADKGQLDKELEELNKGAKEKDATAKAVDKMHMSLKDQLKNWINSSWGMRKITGLLGDLDMGVADIYAGWKIFGGIKDLLGGGFSGLGQGVAKAGTGILGGLTTIGMSIKAGFASVLSKMGLNLGGGGLPGGGGAAGGAGKSILGKFGGKLLGGLGAGVITGGMAYMNGDSAKTATMKGGTAAAGTAIGATLGSALGPVGTFIGGAVGGAIGDAVGETVAKTESWKKFDNNIRSKTNKTNIGQATNNGKTTQKAKSAGGSSGSGGAKVTGEGKEGIWNYLTGQGLSPIAAAGIMGCWESETGNNPKRVEGDYLGSYPGSSAVADADGLNSWTQKLFSIYDNEGIGIQRSGYKGTDGNYYPGIGIAQWTGPRAQRLLGKGNWQDLGTQMDYFWDEFEQRGLMDKMNSANSVADATAKFFDNYEMYEGASSSLGKHISERTKNAEAIYGQMGGPTHSAAIGFDYIPKDNMLVNVHKGERILTKEENKKYYENLADYKGIKENLINQNDSLMVARAKLDAQRKWIEQQNNTSVKETPNNSILGDKQTIQLLKWGFTLIAEKIGNIQTNVSVNTSQEKNSKTAPSLGFMLDSLGNM